MAEVVSLLEAYREAVERRAWDPGQWDCLLSVADWVERLTGEDPGAPWRGRYGGDRGAARLLRAQGGMVRMLAGGLEPLGWRRGGTAEPGAVAAARLPGLGRALHGAVRYGQGWLIASRDGALIGQARPVAIWNPPAGV